MLFLFCLGRLRQKNRKAIQDMMSILKVFLKGRKLELNTNKSKMLVFNRKSRNKKDKWMWNKKEIEEVQACKYLDFVISKNGNYKEHIKKLIRKDRLAARTVWSLGERMCRNNFRRRWTYGDPLVQLNRRHRT